MGIISLVYSILPELPQYCRNSLRQSSRKTKQNNTTKSSHKHHYKDRQAGIYPIVFTKCKDKNIETNKQTRNKKKKIGFLTSCGTNTLIVIKELHYFLEFENPKFKKKFHLKIEFKKTVGKYLNKNNIANALLKTVLRYRVLKLYF